MYHLYEPDLLIIACALTIQVETFTCLVYLIVMFLCIVPFILTRITTLIKLKIGLTVMMLIFSLSATVLKSLVMIKIDGNPIITLEGITDKQA